MKIIVNVKLPETLSSSFLEQIPEYRFELARLMKLGFVTTFLLNSDNSQAWITFKVDSKGEAEELLQSLPLMDQCDFEINELAIFDSTLFMHPEQLLN